MRGSSPASPVAPGVPAGRRGAGVSGRALRPIADYLLALADPTRLRILLALRSGDANASEIARAIGAPPQRVSSHLARLRHAGFVACRRERGASLYRLSSLEALALCDSLCASLADPGDRGGAAPVSPSRKRVAAARPD